MTEHPTKTKGKAAKPKAKQPSTKAREGKLVIKPPPKPGNLGASMLVAAITNPYAYSVRYGGGFTREFTALARPHRISIDDFSTASTFSTWAFDGSTIHAISRDPLHHHAYTVQNPSNIEWYIIPNFRTRRADGTPLFSSRLAANSTQISGTVPLEVQFMSPESVVSHPFVGNRRYSVDQDGYKWFWVDARSGVKVAGDTLFGAAFFNAAGSLKGPTGSSIDFAVCSLYRYGNATPIFSFKCNTNLNGWTACNGATATEKYVDASGFYRLALEVDANYTGVVDTDVYFSFGLHGKTTTIRVDPIEGLDVKEADVFDVRVVGASLMLSSTGVSESVGGTMYGCMFPTGTSILNLFDPNDTAPLSQAPLYDDHVATQPFSKGMYAWHNVTAEEDLAPQNPFVHTTTKMTGIPGAVAGDPTTQVVGYSASMFPRGGWTAVCAQSSLPSNPTVVNGYGVYSGAKVRCTTACSLEFATRSTWYDTQQATAQDTVPAARLMLAKVPNFYENPSHLADIKNWISRNWRGMAKAGLNAAGLWRPELIPLAGAASALL